MNCSKAFRDPRTGTPMDSQFWSGSCYSLIVAVLIAIVVALVIFVIVIGNLLVIAAVILDHKLRHKRQNWLIVSLAAADFLVGLLVMPLTLTYELMNEWAMGFWLCELWLALDVLFVTSSILNLCMISIDRYLAISNPLHYPAKRTPVRMTLMIVTCWSLSFIISFPPVVGWRPERREQDQCTLSTDIGYVLYSAFGSFYIPVLVLIVVYVRIYRITKKRSKQKIREIDYNMSQIDTSAYDDSHYATDNNNSTVENNHKYSSTLLIPSNALDGGGRLISDSSCHSFLSDVNNQSKTTTNRRCKDEVYCQSYEQQNGGTIRLEVKRASASSVFEEQEGQDSSGDAVEATENSHSIAVADLFSGIPIFTSTKSLTNLSQPNTSSNNNVNKGQTSAIHCIFAGTVANAANNNSGQLLSNSHSFVRFSSMKSQDPVPQAARRLRGQLRTLSLRLPSTRRRPNQHSFYRNGKFGSAATSPAGLTRQLTQTQRNALRKRRLLKKQERRQTLVLGLIMLSFVACWMPFFICYLFGAAQLNIPEMVFDVFFWLGYCNSALNPLIYTVFNPEFRRAFIKVLKLQYLQ